MSTPLRTINQAKQITKVNDMIDHPWKTPYNSIPEEGEKNNLPSETIPDQSMTVREIMDNYAKGLPLSNGRVPVWMGEEDMTPENFTKWDLADQETFIKEKAAEFEELKQRFDKEKTERQQKAHERAERLKKIEEHLTNQEQQPKDQEPKK